MEALSLKQIADAVGGTVISGDENIKVIDVQIDSGECHQGSLFVPIVGERRDAHMFIGDAAGHGATAVFVSKDVDIPDGLGAVSVLDTRAALQRLGAVYRERMNVPIIGITGSVGKTTTKEMVFSAISAGKRAIKTKGNWNSQVGLPRMMLEFTSDLEVAVIEMGMSLPHEMERLAVVAAPQCAIITNIGVSHIGNLGSREGIRREKLCVANCFEGRGYLLLNGDDDLLREVKEQRGSLDMLYPETRAALDNADIELYGFSPDCDYRAEDIRETENGTEFSFVCSSKGSSKENRIKILVKLATIGSVHVMNAIAAIAISMHFGVSAETAAEGLSEYRPGAMRGEVEKKNGISIINDAYNASPDSMKSGLEILMKTEGRRHIAVLADMLELGDMTEACHRQTGKDAAEAKVDVLVTVGPDARFIADEAEKRGTMSVKSFDDKDACAEFLKGLLREGDAILFKGSRGMKLEEIIKKLDI